jgi:hypothetical protein
MGSPVPARSPVKEETAFVLLVALAALVKAVDWVRRPLERAAGAKAERTRPTEDQPKQSRYRIYTATSLEESLGRFEERFGLPSDEFYDLYEAGDPLPEGLSHHGANVWAGAWEEYRRLRDEELHADDVFRPSRTAAAL